MKRLLKNCRISWAHSTECPIPRKTMNTEHDLKSLIFKKNDEKESHLEKFSLLIPKLAFYDKPVSSANESSKLIRTQSQRFAPIAMVRINVPFEKFVASVKAKMSRRRSQFEIMTTSHVAPMATGRSTEPARGHIQKTTHGRMLYLQQVQKRFWKLLLQIPSRRKDPMQGYWTGTKSW